MEAFTIKWQGQEATVKADQAFELADAIEQHVTVGELAVMRSVPGRIQYVKLSKAYAAMLMACGIPAKAKDVHGEFTKVLRSATADDRLGMAIEALDWLLMVLMDGAPEPEPDDKPVKDAAPEK